MLTISIADSLQGPAAWSEWGAAGAEAADASEMWQHQVATEWGLEALATEGDLSLGGLPDTSLWNSWPADVGVQGTWDQEREAAAALALATAMHSLQSGYKKVGVPTFPVAEKGVSDAVHGREAAWASPLRVPLPAPLAVEPFSEGIELELEELELPIESVFAEPQKISSPPSLRGHAAEASQPAAAAAATALLQKPAALAQQMPQGMSISAGEVAGKACTRVAWKIDDFSGKLQASMGRPVVSPAFNACGLSNLRLMVFPDARDAVKRARGFERKALYANMVKQGPLYGSLKLKADGLQHETVMNFSLFVGGVRAGPSVYDFSEQAVLGVDDFGVDWLQQIDKASGAVHVGIEIVDVQRK